MSYVEGYIIGWRYRRVIQMCYSMDGGLLSGFVGFRGVLLDNGVVLWDSGVCSWIMLCLSLGGIWMCVLFLRVA